MIGYGLVVAKFDGLIAVFIGFLVVPKPDVFIFMFPSMIVVFVGTGVVSLVSIKAFPITRSLCDVVCS